MPKGQKMKVKKIPELNKDKHKFYVYKRIQGKIEEVPSSFEDALEKAFKEREMINGARA
jgi:hypothetical protein